MTEFDVRMDALRERFIGRCRDEVDVLRKALEADDRPAIADLAHKLAGSAGIYGYTELSIIAQMCEQAARGQGGTDDSVAARTEALLREIEQTVGKGG